jgi:hypothetical protein
MPEVHTEINCFQYGLVARNPQLKSNGNLDRTGKGFRYGQRYDDGVAGGLGEGFDGCALALVAVLVGTDVGRG